MSHSSISPVLALCLLTCLRAVHRSVQGELCSALRIIFRSKSSVRNTVPRRLPCTLHRPHRCFLPEWTPSGLGASPENVVDPSLHVVLVNPRTVSAPRLSFNLSLNYSSCSPPRPSHRHLISDFFRPRGVVLSAGSARLLAAPRRGGLRAPYFVNQCIYGFSLSDTARIQLCRSQDCDRRPAA